METENVQMELSDRTIKGLRYAAFGAVGAALAISPLGFAGADPQDDVNAAPTTVTATVTAMVAPDECEPLPDGKLPEKAVDYATTGTSIAPPPPEAPGDDRLDKTEDAAEDAPEAVEPIKGTGPFDPYTCDPAKVKKPEDKDKETKPTPIDEGPKLGDIPGVKPTLKEYPSNGGGLAESQEGGSGVHLGEPDPTATPTENPPPRGPGGLAPSNPLG